VSQTVRKKEALSPVTRLAPDGTLETGYEPILSDDEMLEAFRLMLLTRIYDERAFNLQRQGRVGTLSTATGQEASVVGSAWALDPARDWVVPQYREMSAMVRQGCKLERFLLYFMGNPVGNEIDEGVNVLPIQISLGSQVPHAVGLAWGLQHQGHDGVVITYFGDGASSEGDVHEAMNLAGVRRAPVIFFLQNNGWAISTQVSKQTAAESFAVRAAGYGFAEAVVDGNDLLAVHEVTKEAVDRARAGEGPTLIESKTYRLGPHNTADDPTRYVDPNELAVQRALDPIDRVRTFLRGRGALTGEAEEKMREELVEEVEHAVRNAETYPPPHPGQLFEHVYAQPFRRFEKQRAKLVGTGDDA
jgi:pyruvate dehydrogenase E1 component alpha subunit